MQANDKGPRRSCVPLRALRTDLARHDSLQSLQGHFSSSIETPRHAKKERNGRKSTRNRGAQVGREVLEGARAVDLSEHGELWMIG